MTADSSPGVDNVVPMARDLTASGVGSVAVLVPCYNEEASVSAVIAAFRAALPEATVYVYDNNSTDDTVAVARHAGAVVRREPRQGKGHVVRRMFADIDADVYVMVDGDDTYDAASARSMVDLVLDEGIDMVVGVRMPSDGTAHRRGHAMGNRVFSGVIRTLFGGEFTDVFSGYRVMSRRFTKSLPVRSGGFELETELSSHAQQIDGIVVEYPTPFVARHAGGESKLHTLRDGFRILFTAMRLFENMHPLRFFGILFVLLSALSVGLGLPVVAEFVRTGLVPRFPTAILAAAIQMVAFICLAAGLVLKSVGRARQEARRLAYLAIGRPARQ